MADAQCGYSHWRVEPRSSASGVCLQGLSHGAELPRTIRSHEKVMKPMDDRQ